jgi:hypothetical protein
MQLQFLGGTDTVTGSKHLITCNGCQRGARFRHVSRAGAMSRMPSTASWAWTRPA